MRYKIVGLLNMLLGILDLVVAGFYGLTLIKLSSLYMQSNVSVGPYLFIAVAIALIIFVTGLFSLFFGFRLTVYSDISKFKLGIIFLFPPGVLFILYLVFQTLSTQSLLGSF